MEKAETGRSILDEYQRFTDLMNYMQRVNTMVKRYQFGHVEDYDRQLLAGGTVSFYAIAIAVKVMCPEDVDAVSVLRALGEDLLKYGQPELGERLLNRSKEYDFGK